uniref:DDE-1 domain-containing protein n=1 Tax=Heterorhabditis bacteriophora TaxID=37862 RepID=A0A1I7X3W2_HETBA
MGLCGCKSSSNGINDSKIALSWIVSSRKFPIFVTNKVDKIRKIHTKFNEQRKSTQFLHTDSQNTLADVVTRGTSSEEFIKQPWITGPQWSGIQDTKARLTPVEELFCNHEDMQIDEMLSKTHLEPSANAFVRFEQYWKKSIKMCEEKPNKDSPQEGENIDEITAEDMRSREARRIDAKKLEAGIQESKYIWTKTV